MEQKDSKGNNPRQSQQQPASAPATRRPGASPANGNTENVSAQRPGQSSRPNPAENRGPGGGQGGPRRPDQGGGQGPDQRPSSPAGAGGQRNSGPSNRSGGGGGGQRSAGPGGPGGGTGGQRNGPGGTGGAGGGQRSGPGGGQRSGGGGGGYRGGGGGQRRGPGGRPGGGRSGGRRPGGRGAAAQSPTFSEAPAPTTPRVDPSAVSEVVIPAQITVRDLADKMRRSPIDVIKALMNYGIMVPITQTIDFDTAAVVGEDLGITVTQEAEPEPEVTEAVEEGPRTLRQKILASEDAESLVIRPPVVTVLGHVDHGKTTLLDAIRETRVVEGEFGGITQHVGAYQVERNGRKITFLDTPGHAAFTAMRARGAQVTDIAVLVVAADDGVMPQTKEAISHVRAAQVPIVVALNKIDKPGANPDRVKQELADNDVLVEEYGGDVVCVPVSAKMRRGIDDLLESLLLVADIDPLLANPNGDCVGTVVESRLDPRRGPTATLLVQNGTLRVGDSIVMGETHGKVRAMLDESERQVTEAPPSTPVVVIGLDEVPVAGDTFQRVSDDRTARSIASERHDTRRAEAATPAQRIVGLENIFAQIEAGQAKDLNLILKADVQGSIEPIVNSLEKLSNDKVRVKILHQAAGNVTDSDVMLAVASSAIILAFNVTVDGAAQRMADAEGVEIRHYNVIYNLVDAVEKALTGLLEPVFKETVTGHLEVRQVFRITKVGKVAGCYVIDGEVARNSLVRVRRGTEVVAEDKLSSLKRFQEDVAEVRTGYECGISLNNFHDLEVGDIVEAYKRERVS